MKCVCWHGKHDVRVEEAPEPEILNPRDAIVRVTSTAICGSDLHLYDGVIPSMKKGDILGHEFMGEVVDVGTDVRNLAPGQRVVVPFAIGCGRCFFCRKGLWSLCDNSNPNAGAAAKLFGYSGSGLFGYSHLFGGYAGGQAEYVRIDFPSRRHGKPTSYSANRRANASRSSCERLEANFHFDIARVGLE